MIRKNYNQSPKLPRYLLGFAIEKSHVNFWIQQTLANIGLFVVHNVDVWLHNGYAFAFADAAASLSCRLVLIFPPIVSAKCQT